MAELENVNCISILLQSWQRLGSSEPKANVSTSYYNKYRDSKRDLVKSGVGQGDMGEDDLLKSLLDHKPANQQAGAEFSHSNLLTPPSQWVHSKLPKMQASLLISTMIPRIMNGAGSTSRAVLVEKR